MDKQKIFCIILLIISIVAIVYACIVPLADWIVYLIAIVFIPGFVLALGVLTMAKPRKEDAEERVKEPFTGY